MKSDGVALPPPGSTATDGKLWVTQPGALLHGALLAPAAQSQNIWDRTIEPIRGRGELRSALSDEDDEIFVAVMMNMWGFSH